MESIDPDGKMGWLLIGLMNSLSPRCLITAANHSKVLMRGALTKAGRELLLLIGKGECPLAIFDLSECQRKERHSVCLNLRHAHAPAKPMIVSVVASSASSVINSLCIS